MARTAETVEKELEKLKAIQGGGAQTVAFGDRRITYKGNEEIDRAIAARENELRRLQGKSTRRHIRTVTNRGVD